MKFTYQVSNLKDFVINTNLEKGIKVEIYADKISEANNKIKIYFADKSSSCKITLTKITF